MRDDSKTTPQLWQERIEMRWSFAASRILVACMAFLPCLLAATLLGGGSTAAERSPRLEIIVGEKAPELERMAAEELATILGRLLDAKVEVGTKPDDAATALILVGQPATNPLLSEAVGNNWPKLSDQGILLRRLKTTRPTLVVGGGSPVATLWAAYELGERLGVRYLHDRDVYPPQIPKPFEGLPALDLVMEPNMRIRCWRLLNEHACGPVSWSLGENRRFLRQMAKMKYNRIVLSFWPCQPFVHYTFRGMPKPPGVLFFGYRYPIDDDTIGRDKFPGMRFFTNPELVGIEEPEALLRRAIGLRTASWRRPGNWVCKLACLFNPSSGRRSL